MKKFVLFVALLAAVIFCVLIVGAINNPKDYLAQRVQALRGVLTPQSVDFGVKGAADDELIKGVLLPEQLYFTEYGKDEEPEDDRT